MNGPGPRDRRTEAHPCDSFTADVFACTAISYFPTVHATSGFQLVVLYVGQRDSWRNRGPVNRAPHPGRWEFGVKFADSSRNAIITVVLPKVFWIYFIS